MKLFRLDSINQPEVAVYASLTENQLRNRLNPEDGVFIVESPKVIQVALQQGFKPLSLLCEEKHIVGDAAEIIEKCGDIPVYTGDRNVLAELTGYTLTRGVLCAVSRPTLPTVSEVCRRASRVAIIDGVVDATNIGAIFRSAAAIGFDAVLLTRQSCDPLNRRAVRVSMGSTFLIPWTWIDNAQSIKAYGFQTAAMALKDRSISIDSPLLKQVDKLALILGSEGYGLSDETIEQSDYVVKIPMCHDVDSLNVAAASAVAFWELRR